MKTGASAQPIEAEIARIWCDVLALPAGSIDPNTNFFALGGDSVLIARVADQVAARFFATNPDDAPGIAEYFSYGTVRSLAGRLVSALGVRPSANVDAEGAEETFVAVVGMACRFPGAQDPDAFWSNLRDGVESIRAFTEEELLEAGVGSSDLKHPAYVKAGVFLDDVRQFDAEYFGLTPREAALTSPEQRLLVECAEEALQDAGYGDCSDVPRVGVFVGTGLSNYLLELIAAERGTLESSQGMALFASNTCAASRVSYLLNLVGPSLTIDTACSSSLVAVHEACQSVLRGECAMALAGGATVRRYAARGYVAERGGIFSPDGHCRPFDQQAQGTVGSSGAGMVLLKRLSAAIADGDAIHAVIRGTAINNDGGSKAGFAAPSAAGQASVIRAALVAARVAPETVRYVETHGTATLLGDAIEVSALRDVFSATLPALGALKANVGHMEAAAGIGGLIKTILVLKHRQIPPAIHFRQWASALGTTQFPMSSRLAWLSSDGTPLRAAVSSFGIGGSNAHAVLEEAPLSLPRERTASAQLLVISARTGTALRESCRRLAARLRADPQVPLADVGHTLRVGRKPFAVRACVVASSTSEAAEALESAAQQPQMTSISHDEAESHEPRSLLRALGRAWQRREVVDWHAIGTSSALRRVHLPAYPFERCEHWALSHHRSQVPAQQAARDRLEISDWFNVPVWEQRPALPVALRAQTAAELTAGCCLLVGGWSELESAIREHVASIGTRVASAPRADASSMVRVFEALEREGTPVGSVVYCAEAADLADAASECPEDAALESGLYGLLDVCTAMTSLRRRPARLVVLTHGAHSVVGETAVSPRRAMLAPATEVIAREFPGTACRTIDVAARRFDLRGRTGDVAFPDLRGRGCDVALPDSPVRPCGFDALRALVTEIFAPPVTDSLIALRGGRRWARNYRRAPLAATESESPLLRRGGAYLITGGMGGIGWTLTRFLAQALAAQLIVVGRSPFPDRSIWSELLEMSAADDPVCARIREIRSLEAAGARVLIVPADVASLDDMHRVVDLAVREFGRLEGVIHAAGVAGTGTLHRKSRESVSAVLKPKVMGTWALYEACKSQRLDFFLCCSSIASVLAPPGWFEYSAANAFQDAFCDAHDGQAGTRFVSIAWDRWKEVGMAAHLAGDADADADDAITPAEGVEVFRRALANAGARWIVSTRALQQVRSDDAPRRAHRTAQASAGEVSGSATTETRSLTAIQNNLSHLWKELLGVEAIRATDDFFTLGGDSLTAVDLHTRLEAQFGRAPSLQELLADSTLSAMAQRLQETVTS